MTQTAINYARVLHELSIPRETIMDTKQAFLSVPELNVFFTNPVISKEKKHEVINRLFPKEIKSFLKVLCNHHSFDEVNDIFEAYEDWERQKQNKLLAKLYYFTAPNEEQLAKIKEFLCKEYKANDVEFMLKEQPELLGGFILRVGDKEYDWSVKGRFQLLKQKLTWR
ncbi:ATP synthase F1 subunit delta [Velocimicrobium porci]|uniref:ATP synthase subunit delta n=1 Tax=Velocimicrobium porci TaxID=2606634 RepID=A0A6L5Y208_9FIRM|nr:ATP synthase F1 subunit delta [Velocimicrobium porci]MSS64781.1 ATP synthase F1 subunit delta [Velocimicrobium porci]